MKRKANAILNNNPLFFLCLVALFPLNFTCTSPLPRKGAHPIPTQIKNNEIKDPDIDRIEAELIRVAGYKDEAAAAVSTIKQHVAEVIEVIDQCKAPQNLMLPFMFANTTLAPSDMLYRRYSIQPCAFYIGDAEIASNNANNHLNYITSMLAEVDSAGFQISQDCQNNGMSDYYKALVKNSLISFRDISEAEVHKIDNFLNDIIAFLDGYKNCR